MNPPVDPAGRAPVADGADARDQPMSPTAPAILRDFAHARTGDKGNRCSISVIAYEPAHWQLLLEQVTEERVAALFRYRQPAAVRRYLLPRLHAMNFVIDEVLDGGVNGSLNLDAHGKSLSSLLLTLTITPKETRTC